MRLGAFSALNLSEISNLDEVSVISCPEPRRKTRLKEVRVFFDAHPHVNIIKVRRKIIYHTICVNTMIRLMIVDKRSVCSHA
ncbi:hypothetical protein J2T56_002014 [Natronobacillus azotifigens]|uniref:Uncharacterized protein n=1 Tax=Natronobacillus azotifigens TaxID=472978 RepID=A0A9J6RDZ4_9BACI|nr:hypothetical protein [Natronobacillus azotifigens]MCZ0703775.1 hypothetical protein [Natronobacillus azotifigens]